MGVSIRAYARHRGVSHVAVIKAIKEGRITPEPDGTIDPEKADAEWEANTVQPKRRKVGPASVGSAAKGGGGVESVAKGRRKSKPGEPKADSADAADAGAPGVSSLGAEVGMSLVEARTLNETLKAKIAEVKLAALRGELVDRAKVVEHVFKLARAERDAWLVWPSRVASQLAVELGVDEHKLFVVLDAAVRQHLEELGEIRVKLDDD